MSVSQAEDKDSYRSNYPHLTSSVDNLNLTLPWAACSPTSCRCAKHMSQEQTRPKFTVSPLTAICFHANRWPAASPKPIESLLRYLRTYFERCGVFFFWAIWAQAGNWLPDLYSKMASKCSAEQRSPAFSTHRADCFVCQVGHLLTHAVLCLTQVDKSRLASAVLTQSQCGHRDCIRGS